jgi:hypothetical protein
MVRNRKAGKRKTTGSQERYDKSVGKPPRPKSLVQFFRESPLVGLDIEFERERDECRNVDPGTDSKTR